MTWRLSASAARRRAAPLRGRGAGRCRGRRGLQGLSVGLPGDGQLGLGEAEPVGQTPAERRLAAAVPGGQQLEPGLGLGLAEDAAEQVSEDNLHKEMYKVLV